MAMYACLYAIGTLPLITQLQGIVKQYSSWYADDSAAGGDILSLNCY